MIRKGFVGFVLALLAHLSLTGFASAPVNQSLPRLQDLGTLGGTNSYGRAVNDVGQIIGFSELQGDLEVHAFIWDPINGMQDLGTLGGSSSESLALNSAGQVVGFSSTRAITSSTRSSGTRSTA